MSVTTELLWKLYNDMDGYRTELIHELDLEKSGSKHAYYLRGELQSIETMKPYLDEILKLDENR